MTRPACLAQAEMSDKLKDQLEHALSDDVSRLRNYVGQDFHGWGSPNPQQPA